VEDYAFLFAHVHSLEVVGFCDLKAIEMSQIHWFPRKRWFPLGKVFISVLGLLLNR
jgi:hypothetical protein